MKRIHLTICCFWTSFFIAICCLGSTARAERVRMITTLGNIDIELFEEIAPVTVANFLSYMNSGDYNRTVIHRSVTGFVIQGGGYSFGDDGFDEIAKKDPIVNEFHLSNLRGTIAMAKLPNLPDSATSEWFFNLVDNSANLDTQNGGFTVFGQVTEESLAVMDAIASLTLYNISQNYGSAFTSVPLIDGKYLVMVYAILYSGDIDLSGTVDLADAVRGLQVMAGVVSQDSYTYAEVDRNGRIGMEEILYILQKVSQSR